MNAKEKQKELITRYLKPTLKQKGFLTSGNTWWRDKGDFFDVIDLQNSQGNSRTKLSFCLNIGPALKSYLCYSKANKISHFDVVVNLREPAFMSEARCKQPHHSGWLGYLIDDSTVINDFITEFAIDLEQQILPTLERLKNLDDWLDFIQEGQFWHEVLTRVIKENPSIQYN